MGFSGLLTGVGAIGRATGGGVCNGLGVPCGCGFGVDISTILANIPVKEG